MAYDVSALIQEVKDRAKDSSLPDSLITTFLQDTQDAVLGHYRLPWLEQTATATLANGDLTYAFPTDHQTTLGLTLTDGTSSLQPGYMSYTVFDRGRFGGVQHEFTLDNFTRAFEPTFRKVLVSSLE